MRRWAVACAIALFAASASADTNAASDHHRAGVAYAKEGRWDDAVRELDEAYKLDPTPLRLYDVAQACLQARQYLKARDAYGRVENDAALGPEQRERARAGRATASANVAHVRATVTNATAADVVTIDGTPATESGREVDPGKHVVRLMRDYALLAEKTLDVAPGADAVAALAGPAPPAPVGEERGSGKKTVAWVLLGVGVPAMITGGVLALVGNNQYRKLKDSCAPSCNGEDRDWRTVTLAGDITLIAGAVLTGVAVFLFVTGSGDARAR